MSKDKKEEEKESFLKKVFKGKVLDGHIEAAKSRTLTENFDLEERRKKLLERTNKLIKDIEEERKK